MNEYMYLYCECGVLKRVFVEAKNDVDAKRIGKELAIDNVDGNSNITFLELICTH